ncbi:DUF4249 domain-containing protein [Portibacter marinus]|uniref:DUF4249 domain-containing protein n=1 Tax=Portibacter marinus TaxID=2898660 RepID=UPI001F2BD3EF|nr:DUF4249 domain-containing protein [Portibacter marinus]
MKNTIILLLAILFLYSCESLIIKDLEVEDTGFEKQLVVQSFIEANTDSIVALISENESILTPIDDIKYLENADVRIFHDGQEFAKLSQEADGRYYVFLGQPITDRGAYEIRVSDTPFEDASAMTIVPEDVVISNLKFKFQAGTDPLDMSPISEISFTIDDPEGKDYYTVEVNDIFLGQDTFFNGIDTIIEERFFGVYPAPTQLDPSVSTSGFSNAFIISDDTFDGQKKEIKLRFVLNYWTSSDNFEELIKKSLNFRFTTHSEDSFLYVTSVNAYDSASDFNIFGEPVSVYTNINSGLGVFAGKSSKIYDFK